MLTYNGRAVFFDDYPSLKAMLDDPDDDITEHHVIVLRNAGPEGGPGMPEWGMIPIPLECDMDFLLTQAGESPNEPDIF